MKYVLGFCFDPTLRRVVLLRKTKPYWQAGKLNGVGGKIEEGRDEMPLAAMIREFKEETGVETFPDEWKQIAIIDNMIFVFAMASPMHASARTTTDEEIGSYYVADLLGNINFADSGCLENLSWLIPLALRSLDQKYKNSLDVTGLIA